MMESIKTKDIIDNVETLKVDLETYTVESSTVMEEMEASLVASIVVVTPGP